MIVLSQKVVLGLLLLAAVLDLVSLSAFVPILPLYNKDHFHFNDVMYSLLFSAHGMTQFMVMAPLGTLGDWYGRKYLMMGSVVGMSLTSLFKGVFFGRVEFLILSFLGGLFGGSIPHIPGYLANLVNTDQKKRIFSLFCGTTFLSSIVAPQMGSALYSVSPQMPLYVAAGMGFLSVAIVGFFVPNTKPSRGTPCPRLGGDNGGSQPPALEQALLKPAPGDLLFPEGEGEMEGLMRTSFSSSSNLMPVASVQSLDKLETRVTEKPKWWIVATLVAIACCKWIAFMCFAFTYSLVLLKRYHAREFVVSAVFSAANVVMMVVQLFIFPVICKRFRLFHICLFGTAIEVTGFFLVTFVTKSMIPNIVLMMVTILGLGFQLPVINMYISIITPYEHQGRYLGIATSCEAAARMVAPFAFSPLFGKAMYLPFLMASVIGCISFVLFLVIGKVRPDF